MGAGCARGARCGALLGALFCALGLVEGCGPGLVVLGAGSNQRCCQCAGAQSCPEQGRNCTCVLAEHHCMDPECGSCKHHPCPPGQQVRPQGKFTFGFECVDCTVGTFSPGHEGRCRPWTDCSKLGFSTEFPGNKTHNARCQPEPVPATQPQCLLTRLVLAVAACSLVLATAQLGLHAWQLRRQQARLPENLQDTPPEDACSCQYPEEERGEQLEDKDWTGSLWV
ncbi:tumor necrosis factor receptor superfamily member 18 isoform X2 [Erinaceus europaeus]|uniref:Tumor necrosis factor receptor superfamily member 18 isoform X2 n=1 Tax=Erinaceus europaeus TaxID=9365 RepID=A0A1S3WEV0_ERIEU|nr:tumor necrosis factor receptor superfamily member 18 isoform X2 [Erinaceus europaeus]